MTPLLPSPPSSPILTGITAPPAPAKRRAFGDTSAMRDLVYSKSLSALQNFKPLTNERHTLSLHDVDFAGPATYTKAQQKQAIMAGQSLGRRIRGTWRLMDNATGQTLDERKSTLATIPFASDRGTFINNGTDYTISNQQRLRSGIFSRLKDNGELEAHTNIMPGEGLAHRYFLDPAKGIFYAQIHQAKIPLMPLLRALGANDHQLRDAWGAEIMGANLQNDNPANLHKFYDRFLPKAMKDADEPTRRQALKDKINSMKLDPMVMQRVLQSPHANLGLDVMLAATKKLLEISQGKAEVDDRDHLAFQTIHGPEDIISERLAKDYGGLQRMLFQRASWSGSLKHISPGALNKQVQAALLHSGLGQALEEVNPSDVFDKQSRITRLGEGSIPSIDSVPDEARSVQPSHLSFLDPVRTPESMRAGVDVHIASGTQKGENGEIYASFKDLKTGKIIQSTPQDVADLAVAFPGEMQKPGNRAWAMQRGKFRWMKKNEIDLDVPHFESAFSPLGNMIPFKSATKGQRMAMGSRFLTQALPVLNAESPWVQTGIPDEPGNSYESRYGENMGALRAKQPGRVMSIDPAGIRVRYQDGSEETHELYSHFPYNRKSVTGRTRVWIRQADGNLWEGPVSDYVPGENDTILSVHPTTKTSAWLPVTGFIKHSNDKRLVRVVTDSGRSVEITVDHSLVTLDAEGHLTPIYPHECVLGRTRLPVANLPQQQELAVAPYKGLLAGLYLAEGHLPEQPGLVLLAVEPDDRASQIMRALTDLGLQPWRSGGNVGFTDHTVRAWLYEHFGCMSGGKFVHPNVLRWCKQAKQFLLNGYFSGDGCLWSDNNNAIQVQAVSTSRRLRDGLVSLLSTFGILTTLFDAPRQHLNPNWEDAYGFRVISSHLHKLPCWFWYKDREQQFRKLVKSQYRASSFDLIPLISRAARRRLYAELTEVPAYVYKTAHQGAVSRRQLLDSTGVFGQWAKSDVMWDTIAAIEPLAHEPFVYDFCVASSEVFAVDHGLIVHNTFLHQTPVIQPGDTFTAGQTLAKSNYTDDKGVTALGLNARVAYLPFRGLNFEDASVISRSFADRLTSEHMYQHRLDRTSDHKLGRGAYISLFPGKYDREQLLKMDEQGVVRPGMTVQHGDPLILGAVSQAPARNKIHRKGSSSFGDASVTWEHHSPGTVTDVLHNDKGISVVVKSTNKMQIGDKLCFDPATWLLTRRGWKQVATITLQDEIATLNPATGCLEYQHPTHLHRYQHDGEMYYLNTKHINMLVTPNHRLWVARPGQDYQAIRADAFYKSKGEWQFKKDCSWIGREQAVMDFGEPRRRYANRRTKVLRSVSMDDWLMFLGFYLAEGWCQATGYVRIGQFRKSPHWQTIADLLTRLGLSWIYEEEGRFSIGNIWLYELLQPLGDSYSKFVPGWVQELSVRQLRIFLDAYLAGDGHKGSCWEYGSSSEQLAEDIQIICFKLGWSVTLKRQERTDNWQKRSHWRGRINRKHLRPWWKKHRAKAYTSNKEEMVHYVGDVFCVTVPNHVVYCKREDKTYWSHNSGRYG